MSVTKFPSCVLIFCSTKNEPPNHEDFEILDDPKNEDNNIKEDDHKMKTKAWWCIFW